MDRGWQLRALGAGLLVGGLAFLLYGTFVAHTQPVVVLLLLLLLPSAGALAGAVVLLVGLARWPITEGRLQVVGRIVTFASIVGVGLGLGVLIESIVTSAPDWAAGLTGILGVGFAVGVGAFVLVGAVWSAVSQPA